MRFIAVITGIFLCTIPAVHAQSASQPEKQLVTKIFNREQEVANQLRNFHPLVETYVQVFGRANDELVPRHDRYFLSTAEFNGQLKALRFRPRGFAPMRFLDETTDSIVPNALEFDPSGFVAMAYPAPGTFDLKHYRMRYLGREFLGEIRCLTFDVQPIGLRQRGLFKGRIWVEDQDNTIVRFNGIYEGSTFSSKYFHFDSWRVNTRPGLWVPAAIYSEEMNLRCCGIGKLNWTTIRFKSQTRFWGYDLPSTNSESRFTRISIDSDIPVKDLSESDENPSPIGQKHRWEEEGERTLSQQLERFGLLAPSGSVESTLSTVVNNIEVTNNLSFDPEIKCRVLLTSRLESFVVGHTVIVSRGLLDVIPDEPTLAALLTHDLAHIALGHTETENLFFADSLMFRPKDTFKKFHSLYSDKQELAATQLAQTWMKNSPYKDSTKSVDCFTQVLRARSFPIYDLLDANMGESAYDIFDAAHSDPRAVTAAKRGEIQALPLGSRVVLDPWTGRIEFRKKMEGINQSKRDNLPFELTPFSPYLKRFVESSSAALPASNESFEQ